TFHPAIFSPDGHPPEEQHASISSSHLVGRRSRRVSRRSMQDTTSPRLSDPAGLTNDVQTLGSVFTTALFQSYQAVSDSIGAMAPPLRFGGELLQATSPTTPAEVSRVYSASP